MNIEKIYFDMDGVLADFDRGVSEMFHTTTEQDDEMWAAIRQVPHFYDRLKPMPGALELFQTVFETYGDRCAILTGIPKEKRGIPAAGADKIAWSHRVLSPAVAVHIVYAEEKKNFCRGPECVLIDDLEKNINAWEESGGTGVLHKSPENTLRILRSLKIL